MSKIDLSKAKIGDKFITKGGRILTLALQWRKYTLIGKGCFVRLNQNGKLYEDNEESKFDLIEQVFNNGDQLDNVEERGEILAEMTKSEFEKARELGIDFLKAYIEQNPEEDNKQELQRRKEVVELAEKMYIMLKAENFKYYLCNNGTTAFESKELVGIALVGASSFIDKKHQYLKDGKL